MEPGLRVSLEDRELMKRRSLGKTGWMVSEIGLGAWQLGGRWGSDFDESVATATLEAALEAGVNFVDTADGYSGGKSEHAVGAFVRKNSG